MKKIVSIVLIMIAIWAYSLIHIDNPYRDKIMAYWDWFKLTQDIWSSNTVDYTSLAGWLEHIVAQSPSRYKPYEFAALFASTLNKLNPTISIENVDRLVALAKQWLEKDCDIDALQNVLTSPVSQLSWLDLPDIICEHKQLPSLLALVYSTYKSDSTYAQKLYFLAQHARDSE